MPNFFSHIPFYLVSLLLVLIIFATNAFFIVYHLIRFGIGTAPKIVAFVFVIGTMFFVLVLIALFGQAQSPNFSLLNPINLP